MARTSFALVGTLFVGLLFPQCVFGQESRGDSAQSPPQKLESFRIKFASARWVADKLTARFGKGTQITFDVVTNTVYLRANEETIRRARAVVTRLDQNRSNGGTSVAFLEHADADRTAESLRALLTVLALFGDEWSCRVFANRRANAIIFLAGRKQEQEIRKMLWWLDEKAKLGNAR